MLNLAQTIAVFASVAVAVVALVRTKHDYEESNRLARLERVLDAVLELQQAAILAQEARGQGATVEMAKTKVRSLMVVSGANLPQTDILTRPGTTPLDRIAAQSDGALQEIADAFDAPVLAHSWPKRLGIG